MIKRTNHGSFGCCLLVSVFDCVQLSNSQSSFSISLTLIFNREKFLVVIVFFAILPLLLIHRLSLYHSMASFRLKSYTHVRTHIKRRKGTIIYGDLQTMMNKNVRRMQACLFFQMCSMSSSRLGSKAPSFASKMMVPGSRLSTVCQTPAGILMAEGSVPACRRKLSFTVPLSS